MTKKVLKAASGQHIEAGSTSGPSSYPSGGFSIETKLGRVDEATVEVDNDSYDARVASKSNEQIQVQVTSTDSANEVSDSNDLSSDTFTYDAKRL